MCSQCEPANQCRDTTVPFDTCCENFQEIKTFSTSVVNKLDEFPGLSKYSVVQFADFGYKEQGLRGADKTSLTIANLEYSGGMTNHKEVSLAVLLDLTYCNYHHLPHHVSRIGTGDPTLQRILVRFQQRQVYDAHY